MSYRSIKRRLGETHLQRKFLAMFFTSFLALIGVSFYFYMRLNDAMVARQNPAKGKLLADTSLIEVHWRKFDEDSTSPLHTPDPAWKKTIDDLSDGVRGKDYDWSFLRPPDAFDPKERSDGGGSEVVKPTDPFEVAVVEKFLNQPSEGEDVREFIPRSMNNGAQYIYYRPSYAQAWCVGCHAPVTGPITLAEGDLIAVIKVTISNADTLREQAYNRAYLWTGAIGITFLAVLMVYLIVRYVIVKPLRHLRDVSDAVSHGNLDQRAEIHTADEFEELAVAFNRMLAHLVTAQEELRRLNSSLDLNVDELAQANMRLFELNRLKSDFLATMSHELRTPLNSIIGFSDVLGSIKSLDDKQRRYVQNIQKSGKMLLDMINDILDLAKIESGKMDVRPSEFRIEQVISAQCDMARPLTERKNLDLETEIEPSLPELYQDRGKVQQVLNNLLSNAIKFTPDGGRIVVAARRGPADELLLTVADTGVGISEEDQAHIFEKFRQGYTVMPSGDAMTREYSGTGLGLSIVKELCKLLGGDVAVQSELGKGSTFTVRLPWRVAEQVRSEPTLASPLSELTRPSRDEFDASRLSGAVIAES
ncbi:MAG TPA: ATP-binding protein [Pirellulales bacterium]|nr:ATP-binding protein [Pirellulales bacterium]